MEKIVWASTKRDIQKENDDMFSNLMEMGLFEKHPDLGNFEEEKEKSLKRSLEIAHKRIFKPMEENDTIKPSHLWIGINPPPGKYTMEKLCQMTKGIVKKYKWMEDNAWCVESHTEGGYRPHIHMMVSYNRNKIRPNAVIRMLANSYKVECNSIECKTYLNGNLFGEHMDYILGTKIKDKEDNVLSDIAERNELNIEHYYTNGKYKKIFNEII
jgi:hypothetical protein